MVAAMAVRVTEAGSCCCQGTDAAHGNDVISPVQDVSSIFGEWGACGRSPRGVCCAASTLPVKEKRRWPTACAETLSSC